mgnify:CR=1 FL=1
MSEGIFTLLGVVIGWLLSFLSENWRDKKREEQERKAVLTKISKEVQAIYNILSSILDRLTNPHLNEFVQVSHLVASLVPPGYSVFSTEAIRSAPPTIPAPLDENIKKFTFTLVLLESLGREIMFYIPPPMVFQDPMMPEHFRQNLEQKAQTHAKKFIEKAKSLANEAKQLAESILEQLKQL